MRKLVQTIGSRDAHQRITATLTFLKLCRCEFPNNLVYVVADHVLIRLDGPGIFLTKQGLGSFHEAVGAKGDLAVGSIRVGNVPEAQ